MLSVFHTRPNRMRAFWVALLVWCTLLQPMLVLACQAHESGHLIQTGHSHDTDGHSEALPADERAQGHDASMLDALLHQEHCCVHNAAILGSSEVCSSERLHAAPEAPVAAAIGMVGLVPMLRPPIRVG